MWLWNPKVLKLTLSEFALFVCAAELGRMQGTVAVTRDQIETLPLFQGKGRRLLGPAINGLLTKQLWDDGMDYTVFMPLVVPDWRAAPAEAFVQPTPEPGPEPPIGWANADTQRILDVEPPPVPPRLAGLVEETATAVAAPTTAEDGDRLLTVATVVYAQNLRMVAGVEENLPHEQMRDSVVEIATAEGIEVTPELATVALEQGAEQLYQRQHAAKEEG